MDHKAQRSFWTSSGVDDSNTEFNPTRLTLAREWNGFTKTELARRSGLTLRSITEHEAGRTTPDEDSLNRLIAALDFGRDFFYGKNLETPTAESASFRGWTKMKAGKRDMALARGAIAIHAIDYMGARLDLPEADLPDLSYEATPEAAAESLRNHWEIGVLSIRNMVHLLEAKGVRVFSINVDARDVDAFSTWSGTTPFVFLNTNKSAERSRYDAAHELGHLVLHRHGAPNGREAETEANMFASAFLMPRASVLTHALRFATLPNLIKLKKIWNVSLAALVYRLHKVGALGDWHYRNLYVEMAQCGYLIEEPESGPRETSQLLPKILSLLYEEGITRSQVAKALCIPLSKLEELMFGLIMMSIDGGGQRSSRAFSSAQPKLARIK
jgi:Zn-dependent peptidase ImmA (M78 family)